MNREFQVRHASAGRRLRNRPNPRRGSGNSGGTSPNRNQSFDSNGPDVRIRGTAFQIQEKYATLAKDAASAGDQVMAESYLQHAEHYQRIINGWFEELNREPVGAQDGFDNYHAPERRYDMRPQQRQQQQPDDLGLPASIVGQPAQPRAEKQPSELAEV